MIENNNQICNRGVWDSSVPGITFNENGVSNYAILFDRLVESYPRGEKGKNDWQAIVQKIRNSNNKNYNCIIGVSGGTDSSYLLYLAKEKYDLKPLAVNLDNGWNSDIAVKNIKNVTSQLDIDLETYVIDYEEIKDLLRAYMRSSLPWIDIPTDLAIKAVLYKIAAENNIKYILRGNDFRSEGTQPREWTYGDGKQLRYIHKKYGSVKLKTFPNYTLKNLIYYGLIKQIKSVYPYYYLNYNKKQAQEFLNKNFGWEYYGGHHYENLFTKFTIQYWLYEKFNIDKRKITFSAQILSGEMDREEALNQISKKPYDVNSADREIEYILKKLDLTKQEFDLLLNQKKKNFTDYPSYYSLLSYISSFASKFNPILKMIFPHKPMALFQAEMRS